MSDSPDFSSELIPAPRAVEALGDLNHDEMHNLKVCEHTVERLGTATWLAGKALHSIQSRRLYRSSHSRFDDYVMERWEMSPRSAYQLIEEWPLAARINGQLGRPAVGSHVRALIPVTRRFGNAAAADLYQQLYVYATQEHVRLTAAVITEVVKAVLDSAGGQMEQTHVREAARQIITADPPPSAKPAVPAARSPREKSAAFVVPTSRTRVQNFPDPRDRPPGRELTARPGATGRLSTDAPPDISHNRNDPPDQAPTRPAPPAPPSSSSPPFAPSGADSTTAFLQGVLVRVIGVERDLAQNIPAGPVRTQRHDQLSRELALRLHRAAQHLLAWAERGG
ncbi:hypothetical protein [Streptomyces sp. NPDC088789]|uniref:hypothetical protein n=1 Tax=Streptomyces sp. NPDC088789 TaxID=3365899 RepID=UPI003803057B